MPHDERAVQRAGGPPAGGRGGGAALAGKIHRKPGDSTEPGVTVPLGLRSRGAPPPAFASAA
eukprot:4931494-Lingulodinium_polyedra.AAC.1